MNYSSTRLQKYHVKQLLGHRRLETTLKYIHVANAVCTEHRLFDCKVANSEAEAKSLIEDGFDYVCDVDGVKLFRKPK